MEEIVTPQAEVSYWTRNLEALKGYAQYYSDADFWAKVRTAALAAGREGIHKALCLYYSACDPATPMWAKGAILGALGYFIFPIDAIPDAIPVIGYSDDLAVLAAAVLAVAAHLTPEHRKRADETIRTWFGAGS
jgi:uncharacterized membrane protein YkvA (DUF1232 family)